MDNQEEDDDEDSALFYSDLMPMLVDKHTTFLLQLLGFWFFIFILWYDTSVTALLICNPIAWSFLAHVWLQYEFFEIL